MPRNCAGVQIGETRREFPFRAFVNDFIPTYGHWHAEYEFVMAVRGRMEVSVGGRSYLLPEGGIMMACPGDIHGIVASNHSRYVVQFLPELIEGPFLDTREAAALHHMVDSLPRTSLSWPEETRGKIARLITELTEGENAGLSHRLFVQSRIFGLMNLLVSEIPEEADQHTKASLYQNKSALDRLAVVLDYVKLHYNESIPIEKAAALLDITPNHFIKFWRRYMDISFHAYLNEYRISRAMHLFFNTTGPIYEIAYTVGFENAKTFSRVFRQVTGMTPGAYRALLAEYE